MTTRRNRTMSNATKRDLRAEARERTLRNLEEAIRTTPARPVPTLLSEYRGSVIFPREEDLREPDPED